MWKYRDLIWNLAWATFKNRYQNTYLGFIWSLLGPLVMTGVLYLVFRNLFSQGGGYAINILVGIMCWRFFTSGTNSCLSSIVSRPNLVTKVYIPRQILVISTAIASLISSLLEFIVVIPFIYFVQGSLGPLVVLYPLIHLIYIFFILGIGLILSSIYVYLRDLNQIWEVLLSILFFASPIFYPLSAVGSQLLPYYKLNPITCYITIYRDLLVNGTMSDIQFYITAAIFTMLVVVFGYIIFSKLQRRFAEVI